MRAVDGCGEATLAFVIIPWHPATILWGMGMRRNRILALLVVLAGPAGAREDWMYMSQWRVAHDLSPAVTVDVLGEAYLRDDLTDDFVYDGYLTFAWRPGTGFALFGQYLLAVVEPADAGSWSTSEMAVGGVSHTTDLPGIGWLRLQERVYDRLDSPSGWDHHRPRIFLGRDVGPISLTISSEARFDLTGDRPQEFFRNRFFATATWKAARFLSLGLGYFRQWDHNADGHWTEANGLQTAVTVSL